MAGFLTVNQACVAQVGSIPTASNLNRAGMSISGVAGIDFIYSRLTLAGGQ